MIELREIEHKTPPFHCNAVQVKMESTGRLLSLRSEETQRICAPWTSAKLKYLVKQAGNIMTAGH